ncbi:hypothetical protein IJH74_01970 [Candidatus Saccharibacteria bacterium]|nr:hypothetical protein [Candidatus Saccharibacteria bacterium]
MFVLRDPLEELFTKFPPEYQKGVYPLIAKTRAWQAERAKGSNKLDSTTEDIKKLKSEFMKMEPSEEFMKTLWPRFEKMLENPALIDLVYFAGGEKSRFLIPMLATLPTATSLEMAFLHGLDIDMQITEVPETDPYYDTARREELFKYIRMRSAWSAGVVSEKRPKKLLYLGCGRMFSTRYIHQLSGEQLAVCTDTDTSITAENLFPDGQERAHYQVYHIPNEEIFKQEGMDEFEFVEMMGQMIYRFTEEDCAELKSYVEEVFEHMAPNADFVFDVNCQHPDWEKLLLPIAFARGGLRITFLKDNSEIVDFFLREILADLPIKEYRVRSLKFGDRDIGVLFWLTK